MYAQAAASAGWLRGALVLPAHMARDIGLLLLAVHLALQVSAGFATRRLLVRVGLDRAALVGALLFTFAPPLLPGAAGDGAALGASVALLLLATERCVAPVAPGEGGALGLAAAIIALGMFGDPTELEAGGALSILWAAGRLATPLPLGRGRALARLLTGAAIGLLIAVPLNTALNTAAGAIGLAEAETAAQSLGEWLGWLHPRARWDARPLAEAAAPTLPLLAAGLLGLARRSTWPIRAALGASCALTALVVVWRAGAAAENAGPVLFLGLAALAAIAMRDAVKHAPATLLVRSVVALCVVLAAAGIVVLLGRTEIRILVGLEAACALLALALAARPVALGVAVLVGVGGGYETALMAAAF